MARIKWIDHLEDRNKIVTCQNWTVYGLEIYGPGSMANKILLSLPRRQRALSNSWSWRIHSPYATKKPEVNVVTYLYTEKAHLYWPVMNVHFQTIKFYLWPSIFRCRNFSFLFTVHVWYERTFWHSLGNYKLKICLNTVNHL